MNIEKKVKEIIADPNHLNLDADSIENGAHFQNDLGADSLDVVELVMAFEELLDELGAEDTEIKDEEAEKIQTVQDAIDFIKARV